MRQVLDGSGNDSTAATQTWLLSTREPLFATLVLIGDPESPYSYWLTDWPSPLTWSLWGTFNPSVLTRGKVTSEIGLKVQSMDISWSPPVGLFTPVLATASPYQKLRLGWFDNWPISVWTVYMKTPGDANTLGASALFGGRVGKCSMERGIIKFTVNSFLDALNQPVPGAVIEAQNLVAPSRGAQPPAGLSTVPQFAVGPSGSSETIIIGDAVTPTAHQIFGLNLFQYGFLVFNDSAGATLGRAWSVVAGNKDIIIGGVHYNQFTLYSPMPWAPTSGLDTFYVSAAYPLNQSDGSYYGFPFVPAPETAF